MGKEVRIHLSYSDRHYHPERNHPETEWYSCSQIARHIWQVLKNRYANVTYGDTVPSEPLDLLWTNRLCKRRPDIARMATFASVAHYAYVTRQVCAARRLASCSSPEGCYSFKERWNHWRTLSQSDVILAIGNECIDRSFAVQMPCGPICTVNCGVDTNHFIIAGNQIRKPVFVHNATRFSVRKGSHLVAEAWSRVAKNLPEARLVLLGRNGDVDMTELLGNFPNVNLTGEYESGGSEYRRQLNTSRWVVLPSLAEGQAGTLLEAMSCGCVPIASRSTGVDAERYGGYPLEPNTVESLVDAMLLAASEWKPDKCVLVQEQTAKWHDWNEFEGHVLKLTDQLLAEPPRSMPLSITILGGFVFHLVRNIKGWKK